MPSSYTITMHVGDVVRVLHVMEAAMDNPSDLMRDVLLHMIRAAHKRFEAQGPGWAEHAESTKRRRGDGALILRDQGLLMQGVTGNGSGPFDTPEGFGISDEFTAVIGVNVRGWQNQFPDSRGWRPARPFVLFQDQDEEDIADMAMDWMLKRGPYVVAGV
jgi:phage gpG-like protein